MCVRGPRPPAAWRWWRPGSPLPSWCTSHTHQRSRRFRRHRHLRSHRPRCHRNLDRCHRRFPSRPGSARCSCRRSRCSRRSYRPAACSSSSWWWSYRQSRRHRRRRSTLRETSESRCSGTHRTRRPRRRRRCRSRGAARAWRLRPYRGCCSPGRTRAPSTFPRHCRMPRAALSTPHGRRSTWNSGGSFPRESLRFQRRRSRL